MSVSARPSKRKRCRSRMRASITDRNLQVLAALRDIQRDTGGFPPTVREVGHQLGISSPSTVQKHMEKLVRFGLVERRGHRRTITTLGYSVLNGGRVAA